MDALEFLKTTIPDFAGYEDESSRRITDEQIRAFVGEALALLAATHAEFFSGDAQQLYDGLLMHCEFADQEVLHDFETATGNVAALAAADAALIRLAPRAETVDAASLQGFMGELKSAFEARDRTYRGTAA